MKRKIWNKCTEQFEILEETQCPRCKGFGATISDNGEMCEICKGIGRVFIGESGITLTIGDTDDYQKYY